MSAFAQGKARYRRGTLLSRIGELFSARLGNRQAAEDVAHDAYLRVLERRGRADRAPAAFLYRTALNLVVDRHRRQLVRQAEPLEVLDSDERWHSPALTQSMQQDQRLALMQQALDELTRCAATASCCARSKACRTRRSPSAGHLPQPGGKAHRQCHEALPGAHAAVGILNGR
jgi:hypothetical protein